MDYSKAQLQKAAQRTANVYAEIANEMFGCTIPVPVPMQFNLQDLKPKSSADACHDMKIRVNMILFQENYEDVINNTLPHEVGHLVQINKFDLNGVKTKDHGAEWQEIMRRFGKTPRKTHDYDITNSVAHYKNVQKIAKQKAAAALKKAEQE
jgi:predicted SprT family Zn-dependent metalloprotease